MNKVTYVDGVTVIGADNLNEIQDAIIDLENDTGAVPTNVRQAILSLFESAAYAETGLTDEIAVVQSWASEVTEISLSASTLTLNGDTPQTLVATTVPTGSTVIWSTSDSTIATVVGGVVTGVSNGTCTITAMSGTKSATCAVTVTGFAELVSISAVYTQSGTVYDTATLDDLKADLVVTATYSDSSTAVVTDYTLSGTLTEGTSTITVIYGGKATTFNVTVTAYYQTLNYVQPSGEAYIDIGYIPNANTKIELDYENIKPGGDAFQAPIGVAADTGTSADGKQLYMYISSTNTAIASMANGSNLGREGAIISVNQRATYIIDSTGFYIDNVSYGLPLSDAAINNNKFLTGSVGFDLYLFARNHGNALIRAYATGKMYGLSIYENNVLVRHYVPRKRTTDNAYGVLDTVNDTFYVGSGTGTITGA